MALLVVTGVVYIVLAGRLLLGFHQDHWMAYTDTQEGIFTWKRPWFDPKTLQDRLRATGQSDKWQTCDRTQAGTDPDFVTDSQGMERGENKTRQSRTGSHSFNIVHVNLCTEQGDCVQWILLTHLRDAAKNRPCRGPPTGNFFNDTVATIPQAAVVIIPSVYKHVCNQMFSLDCFRCSSRKLLGNNFCVCRLRLDTFLHRSQGSKYMISKICCWPGCVPLVILLKEVDALLENLRLTANFLSVCSTFVLRDVYTRRG